MPSRVGHVVEVYWDDDEEWWRGVVQDEGPRGLHVRYDDGDVEWVDESEATIRFLTGDDDDDDDEEEAPSGVDRSKAAFEQWKEEKRAALRDGFSGDEDDEEPPKSKGKRKR